jgi:hypothetical protein
VGEGCWEHSNDPLGSVEGREFGSWIQLNRKVQYDDTVTSSAYAQMISSIPILLTKFLF